jgi:hypothetical protein
MRRVLLAVVFGLVLAPALAQRTHKAPLHGKDWMAVTGARVAAFDRHTAWGPILDEWPSRAPSASSQRVRRGLLLPRSCAPALALPRVAS